jgi:large conductance mechanosensitive channel
VLKEFRDFINRGNVVDLAVAFVLGVAFKEVIDVLVGRVIMPIIGMIAGEPNFDRLGEFACGEVTNEAGEIVTQCAGSVGAVLTVALNFVLIAFALFLIVKAYNKFKAAQPEEDVADAEEVVLLREIRDSLRR